MYVGILISKILIKTFIYDDLNIILQNHAKFKSTFKLAHSRVCNIHPYGRAYGLCGLRFSARGSEDRRFDTRLHQFSD